jgi:thymidine phosphorylase
MLRAAGIDGVDPADALAGGRAMDHWRAMITAQGGDPDAALPTARHVEVIRAPESGVLARLDAMAVGIAAWRLGAGRTRQDEAVQAAAGVTMHVKPGESVQVGAPLLALHTDEVERLPRAVEALAGAWEIGASAPKQALVLDRIAD